MKKMMNHLILIAFGRYYFGGSGSNLVGPVQIVPQKPAIHTQIHNNVYHLNQPFCTKIGNGHTQNEYVVDFSWSAGCAYRGVLLQTGITLTPNK